MLYLDRSLCAESANVEHRETFIDKYVILFRIVRYMCQKHIFVCASLMRLLKIKMHLKHKNPETIFTNIIYWLIKKHDPRFLIR